MAILMLMWISCGCCSFYASFFNEVNQFITAGGLGNGFTMFLQKYAYHTTQEKMDAVTKKENL